MKPSEPNTAPSNPTENKPKFLRAVEELAREKGMTWEELLRQNRERAGASGYPGPECLLPGEIESLSLEGASLPAERENHVASCSACAALVEGARADPAEVQEIVALVRERNRAQADPPHVEDEGGRPVAASVTRAGIVGGAALAGVAIVASLPSLIKLIRRVFTSTPSEPPEIATD